MSKSKSWASVDLTKVPTIKVTPPGPKSKQVHERTTKYFKGLSSQVKLFPVVFESGKGVTLTDVDGNTYIDFSSGIYVTTLGHCHPKITEQVQKYAGLLMNAHDFSTPIKMKLVEKLASILPKGLTCMQFYDSGTAAVEAGLRVLRAATGKYEVMSFYNDFHGKTLGATSCALMTKGSGLRAPGFFLAPRPYCYRCPFKMKYPDCGLYCADFIKTVIQQQGSGSMAGIILEPIQGWGGSVIPPDGFMQKLRKICDELKILLYADEVLTSMGRTGKWLAMNHWDVVPDIVTMGKGFGNGFPVTAMVAREDFGGLFESISASSSYGGNPMACAAALASIEVIEEENLLQKSLDLGKYILKRLKKIEKTHHIVGEVRGRGCLLGIELIKDKKTKEPFNEAGKLIYQKAFRKGLAWIPAGHILRLSPPIVMDNEVADKGLDIIEEAIFEVEKEFGYTK
ncbi:MAG: aspartate aminotransferase family protein [Elusimicrobiota bacterium]